jgi:hypothetical protein
VKKTRRQSHVNLWCKHTELEKRDRRAQTAAPKSGLDEVRLQRLSVPEFRVSHRFSDSGTYRELLERLSMNGFE